MTTQADDDFASQPLDEGSRAIVLYSSRERHAIDMEHLLGLTHNSIQEAIQHVPDPQLLLEMLDFLHSCGALVPSIPSVMACIGTSTELLQWLLQHGASPHCLTAVLEQPDFGDDCLRLLLQHGADLESDSYSDHSPLHHAISPGRMHRMQLLLAQGADPNAGNYFSTVCCHLVDSTERMMAVRLLTDAKADLDGRPEDRPLTAAILFGHWDVVSLLLLGGADPNADDYLCRACEAPYGALECVTALELLLMHGANVNGTPGRRPLRWALAMAEVAEDLEPARLLLQHHAELDMLDDDEPFLTQAVQHPTLAKECTQLLLAAGADPSLLDSEGRTAFDYCSPGSEAYWLLLHALPPGSFVRGPAQQAAHDAGLQRQHSGDSWQLEPWSWDPQVRKAQQDELRRLIGAGSMRPSDRVASHNVLTDNLALVDVLAQTSLPRLIEESRGRIEDISAQDLMQLASSMAVGERGRSHSAPLMHPSLLRSFLANTGQFIGRQSG